MVDFIARSATDPNQARPPRTARVQVVTSQDKGPGKLFELLIDLDQEAVVSKQHLVGKHPFIDPEYMKAAEKACNEDEKVQAEIAKLELPPEATVCIEPWAYAPDGMSDMALRTTMASTQLDDTMISTTDERHSAISTCGCWTIQMPTSSLILLIYVPKFLRI